MPDVIEDSGDRLVLRLDPGGPVELAGLTESFGALARMYARHYRSDSEPAPRLYVTRLQTGSVIAEIAPYAMIMGALVTTMGGANTIADFANRLSYGIKAFSDPTVARSANPAERGPVISRDDAADIRAFVRPLAGKNGAHLNIKHARLAVSERPDGERHTVVEYEFDENELNRASINIDQALSGDAETLALTDEELPPDTSESILRDAMLFFEQASRRPGRERGRTGDKGIIPDVSPKALPVYFRRSFQNLKDQMVRGQANPLTNNAFIVDVYVHRNEADEPKAYYVTNVHRVVPLGEDS